MTSTLSGSIHPHCVMAPRAGIARLMLGVAAVLVMAGCASPNKYRAPVEDRSLATRQPAAAAPVAAAASAPATAEPAVKPLPGSENAGKAGYYSVKPGDTLIRIGLETGQSWKDILKWNNLENPNVIEVGQVLRVVPPGVDPNAVSTRPVTLPRLESRPLDAKNPPAPPPNAASTPPAPPPVMPAPPVAREGDDNVNWLWPATGSVVGTFDESRTKGIAIAGKAGDPVVAAADGKVVYAGSGLRGYGNLVIIKHNNTYLTAYAHNQALMVKEEQAVKRGQKIAEMGSSDAERVQLHFEIRKQGKPIDPARLLPPR